MKIYTVAGIILKMRITYRHGVKVKILFDIDFTVSNPFKKNLATLTHIFMVVFSFSKQMTGRDSVMVKFFNMFHSSVGNSSCCVLKITSNMTRRDSHNRNVCRGKSPKKWLTKLYGY